MTVPVVLAIAGVIGLFLGIWGGGIKAKEVEVPPASPSVRLIVGIIGFVFLGTSIWLSAPSSTNSQLMEPTKQISTPEAVATANTPIPTIGAGTVLLAENFEDGQIQGMSISGNGKILSENTGNKVIDSDRPSGISFLGFGSEAWENYSTEFRVTFLSTQNYGADLEFRRTCDSQNCTRYIMTIRTDAINLYYDSPQTPYTPIEGSAYKFEPQTWYFIRIEARGVNIKIYVNNSLIIDANDSKLTKGSLLLGVEGGHVQFDDFLVIALDK